MTDRELMQQALEALELVTDLTNHDDAIYAAIDALRERLAQPVQEPVAWRWLYGGKPEDDTCFPMPGPDADLVERGALCRIPVTPQYLYTAPQPRQWQGLTDSDWKQLYDEFAMGQELDEFAEAIEAALREKNT